MNLRSIALINPSEMEWVATALQRYVRHRVVDQPFLDHLLALDRPGKAIDPDDPDYGDQVLQAFIDALVFRRQRRNHLSTSKDPVVLQIQRDMPDAFRMMQSLEEANVEYTATWIVADTS